jgi:hypothetical protein
MIYFLPQSNIDYRIVTPRNLVEDITNYDLDNAYPQRVKEYAKASSNAMRCLRTRSRFIVGRGFRDKVFYKAKVNRLGQTADQLLRQLVKESFSHFDSFVWLIRYNANFKVVEVLNVDFEWVRNGLPDYENQVVKHAVYDDWDRKLYKNKNNLNIKYYDKFNPNPDVIKKQVERAGGWSKWKGQILYVSPVPLYKYPEAIYDSVLDDILTDAEIKRYDLRTATDDFSATKVYYHPTELSTKPDPDDPEGLSPWERKAQQLRGFQGANGSRMVMVDNAELGFEYFKNLDVSNSHDKYLNISERVKNSIRELFCIPPVLVGEEMSAGLANDSVMKNAYEMYSSDTEAERYTIEEAFKIVFSLFKHPINTTGDFSIEPLKWTGVTVQPTNF